MANLNELAKLFGVKEEEEKKTPIMTQEALVPKMPEPTQPSELPTIDNALSPKERYIETQVVPARQIVVPQIGGYQETAQERQDRLDREKALTDRLDKAKVDYQAALDDAKNREFKQSLWAALGNNLPNIIAGATAMNTKAAVKPLDLGKVQVDDLQSAVDKRYKTDYEKILGQYKQLASGNLTPKDRANLEARAASMALTAQAIQGNNEQRAASARNAEEDRFEKKVETLGKATENNARAYNSLNAIDDVLKSSGISDIDNLNVKNGKVLNKEGKEVDLPGVSIPGLGRVTIGNDKAQNLESTMSTVFNTELKDRSGASVTSPELERLKTEFGQGKFNTEAQMVSALQRYKKLVGQALAAAEARYEAPILEEYKSRGGITSENFKPKNSEKTVVKTLRNKKTGQIKYIYSDGSEEVK